MLNAVPRLKWEYYSYVGQSRKSILYNKDKKYIIVYNPVTSLSLSRIIYRTWLYVLYLHTNDSTVVLFAKASPQTPK